MKMKLLLFICLFFCFHASWSQTFSGAGGSIPDNGTGLSFFPVNVTGIGNTGNNLGVSSVCVDITHSWVSDLEIYLQSPDGTMVPLSIQNGGSGTNYTGTCFSGTASSAIANAGAPFTGNFIPDGYLGAVNNGQNANGVWNLCVKDIAAGETGNLLQWSIIFSSGLPPSPPDCNGNPMPGNTCLTATPVCSFFGFCGRTSSLYTADSWTGLDQSFCGTVQNNAFVKFVATGYEMNFNVWVTSSINHDGIQMFFYDGGCGSGTINDYGCYSPIRPGASPTLISATGLTAGNVYYLMIDGYAGDVCDYVIEPYPALGGLAVMAAQDSVCSGKPVQLSATGGSGIYSWVGSGLNATAGSNVIATPATSTTYAVTSTDPGGICPITKHVTVHAIDLPAAPTVRDSLSYCQSATAIPALTATGINLLWYYSIMGGNGSSQAIVPSALVEGTSHYYVSQTVASCESPRTVVTVIVISRPSLGADVEDTICFAGTADLTRLFNTNFSSRWYFHGRELADPHSASVAGDYELVATNENECRDTAVVHLVRRQPVLVFAGNDTTAVRGSVVQLNAGPAATYAWSPEWLLNNPFIQHPVTTADHDQQFVLRAKDRMGCEGSDTMMIRIIKGINYYIPNAFSPNGDQLNDVFRIMPADIDHTEVFKILNRYGKIIFESSDPFSKGWDGTYLNVPQAAGTYIWYLKGIDKNKKEVEMKGTIILIR